MDDLTPFHALQAFRTGVYQRRGARRDALFEALDAATTVGPVPSLPYLSLAALHRRGGGRLYPGLAGGGPRGGRPSGRPGAPPRWTTGSRPTPGMRVSGRAATPAPAPSGATTAPPRGSPPGSR